MIRKVKVGASRYTVRISKTDVEQHSEDVALHAGDATEAYSDHKNLEIVLLPGVAEDVSRASLLHEVLHCCLRASGAWPDEFARILIRSRGESNLDIEEFTIASITGPLLQTLRENPELAKYLLG